MGAVTTTDAGRLIDPHSLGLERSAQHRLQASFLIPVEGGCDIGGSRWISHRINDVENVSASGVPTGHHKLDRSILAITLLCDIKTFLTGGLKN